MKWTIIRRLLFGVHNAKGKSMRASMPNESKNDENCILRVSTFITQGDREDQQDCFGYYLHDTEGFFTVCDGMGGREGGALASRIAVDSILAEYEEQYPVEGVQHFLEESAKNASDKISQLQNANGVPLGAGSTCVQVLIQNNDMYWSSVGDSRLYLLREEEFLQLTIDQTYGTVLSEQYKNGDIDAETYIRESKTRKAEALISYLGMDQLELVAGSVEPIKVLPGDRIVIMSDGLYKIVPDDEMKRVLVNFRNLRETIHALEQKAHKNAKYQEKSRDNMTVMIIEIK